MINVSILSHNFQKQNLVTITKGGKSYDLYKCKACGLEGKRESLSDNIAVKRDKVNCPFKKAFIVKIKAAKKVKVDDPRGYLFGNFGLKHNEIMTVVDCPDEHREKLSNEIWVHSPSRNEPVRLLKGEYHFINE